MSAQANPRSSVRSDRGSTRRGGPMATTLAEPLDAEAGPGLPEIDHFDVVIVGAGISGIGAACHLAAQCPDKRFVILEAQETFGGTWWTHRYPGVRSDSDLFTFGYRFKPWKGAALANGAEILAYLEDVIADHGLAPSIRYGHRVQSAGWSTTDRRWSVTVRRE